MPLPDDFTFQDADFHAIYILGPYTGFINSQSQLFRAAAPTKTTTSTPPPAKKSNFKTSFPCQIGIYSR